MPIIIKALNQTALLWMSASIGLQLLLRKMPKGCVTWLVLCLTWPLRFILNLPFQIVVLLNYLKAYNLFKRHNSLIVEGLANLPKGVGTLYLSNHQAWTDPWAVGLAIMSVSRLLTQPAIMHWTVAEDKNYGQTLLGPYLRFSKMTAITRPTNNSFAAAKRAMLELKKNLVVWQQLLTVSNLLIYFEGTRSRQDNTVVRKCKAGVTKLIFESMLAGNGQSVIKQIVPIRLVDFYKIQPAEKDKTAIKGAKLKLKDIAQGQTCRIIIGQPISREELIKELDYSPQTRYSDRKLKLGDYIIDSVDKLYTLN
ncbi:MAG: lysophospholipid acyltransferase family protein [bacterium]